MTKQTYIDIVFDGPPGPISGRFVEVERDGASIGIGEWVQQDDLWMLRIPDFEAEFARLREVVEKQRTELRAWHEDAIEAVNDTEHHLKDERNGIRMTLALFHRSEVLMAALEGGRGAAMSELTPEGLRAWDFADTNDLEDIATAWKADQAELARLRERPFPMQDGPPIPWSLAERIYFVYADLFGTSQSLERLAERGGFGWSEIPHLRTDYRSKYGRFPDWTATLAALEAGETDSTIPDDPNLDERFIQEIDNFDPGMRNVG